MREEKDKRGGGLMIIKQKKNEITLTKENSEHADVLTTKLKVGYTNITMILVYFSVERNNEDKQRNLKIKATIERKINEASNDAVIILGDFNGHTGLLGTQKIDNMGRVIMDWIADYNLVLMNCDMKCEGTYTWSQREQKSVIDYVMVNKEAYDIIKYMKIDENKEILDITDHNIITIGMGITTNNFRKGKWIKREYYKTDPDSLKRFLDETERRIKQQELKDINQINKVMKETADNLLKNTYTRKDNKEEIIE